MSLCTRMHTRVPRRRTVAAQRHATGLAGSQMHPRAAELDALFADVALGLLVSRIAVRCAQTCLAMTRFTGCRKGRLGASA